MISANLSAIFYLISGVLFILALRGLSSPETSRQGDEGCSIFFVSLQDDLMRIFGSESMNSVLEKLGLKDGESIDHPWINKAIERAQQKIEARNFDIRKTLIKFDNVLNDQRHVIFSQREKIITTTNIFEFSDEFLQEMINNLIQLKSKKLNNPQNNEFEKKLKSLIGKNFDEEKINSFNHNSNDHLKEEIKKHFESIRNERIRLLGEKQAQEIEKRIFLQSIDLNWKSHIQYLEQLRQVIGLRSYGQRDPLVEYKKEAFELFENLLYKLKIDYLTILLNLKVVEKKESIVREKNKDISGNPKCLFLIKKGQKISRNERCEATGKKYKNCCGAL